MPDELANFYFEQIVDSSGTLNIVGGDSRFNDIFTTIGATPEIWKDFCDIYSQARLQTQRDNYIGSPDFDTILTQIINTKPTKTILKNITTHIIKIFFTNPAGLTGETPEFETRLDKKNEANSILYRRNYTISDIPLNILVGTRADQFASSSIYKQQVDAFEKNLQEFSTQLGAQTLSRELNNASGAIGATKKLLEMLQKSNEGLKSVLTLLGVFGYKGTKHEQKVITKATIGLLQYFKRDLKLPGIPSSLMEFSPNFISDLAHMFGIRVSDAQRHQAKDSPSWDKDEQYKELEHILQAAGLSQEHVEEIMGQFRLALILRKIPVLGDIIFLTFMATISALTKEHK